jgi:hypothetical protein
VRGVGESYLWRLDVKASACSCPSAREKKQKLESPLPEIVANLFYKDIFSSSKTEFRIDRQLS